MFFCECHSEIFAGLLGCCCGPLQTYKFLLIFSYLSFVCGYYIKLGVCEVNVKILTTVLYLRPKSDRGTRLKLLSWTIVGFFWGFWTFSSKWRKSLDNGDEIFVNLKDLVEISFRRKVHMAEEMWEEGVFWSDQMRSSLEHINQLVLLK